MANDRDCKNCKHRSEGGCSQWDCNFEPKKTTLKQEEMPEMQENNDCIGNCANCGNTECEWYDDFLDGEEYE